MSVAQVWLKQVVSHALRTPDIGARYEARRIIATKDSLIAADAERGERALQEWLASIATEAEVSAQKIKSRRKT